MNHTETEELNKLFVHCPQSGWNIFQREHMAGQQMEPGQWKLVLQQCKNKWKQMSVGEQSQYHIKAAEEQGLRQEACIQPFSPKVKQESADVPSYFPASFDASSQLSHKALKKVGRHRALATYKEYKQSTPWKWFDAGLATPDGALALDFIDVDSQEQALVGQWGAFARESPSKDWLPASADPDLHHSTCWKDYGSCREDLHVTLVGRLVSSLAKHLESGFLSNIAAFNFPGNCFN